MPLILTPNMYKFVLRLSKRRRICRCNTHSH